MFQCFAEAQNLYEFCNLGEESALFKDYQDVTNCKSMAKDMGQEKQTIISNLCRTNNWSNNCNNYYT